MDSIFVDSSAWYALANEKDVNHPLARQFLTKNCTSFAVMSRLELIHAFTFDADFSQTGQFTRVP